MKWNLQDSSLLSDYLAYNLPGGRVLLQTRTTTTPGGVPGVGLVVVDHCQVNSEGELYSPVDQTDHILQQWRDRCEELRIELKNAQACARILAVAYEHGVDPPSSVVAQGRSYAARHDP